MNLDTIDWTVNGYPIVAGRPTGEREALVVADRGGPGIYDCWVTWRLFLRDDGQLIAYSGFYTPSLRDALANMDER
jgi:hypothetical protein